MNIIIIAGSPRQGSITARVAYYLKNRLSTEHSAEVVDLREWVLPPMQSVYNTEEKTPAEFLPLREKMFSADAFILVTPEYNGGYSPALKNMLDHFPKTTYARKAMGIVTASDGAFGGMRAAMQMQQLVCALFGIPSPQMMVVPQVDKKFDENGNLVDENYNRNIDNFLNEYLWLANGLHQCRKLTS